MSTTLATGLVMTIYACGLVPLAVAYWKPRLFPSLIWAYGIPILGIAFYQGGLFPQALPVEVPPGELERANSSAGRCAEIFGLLERERVILNRSDPSRLVVSRDLWGQLPQQVRAAVVECAENARRPGTNPDPVQVVEQPTG